MAGKEPGQPIYRGSGPASYSFLPPSYDTHRQFDYGVCVQHFGEHVSDDRRKRGREEREEGRRIIGNRDTQQRERERREHFAHAHSHVRESAHISLLVGGRTEWVIRSIFLGLLFQ